MPALGESVTEGTVTRWLKSEGDRVAIDEPLLEVSTDKVDTEIPSPAAGVLQKIVVAVDQVAQVGAELALIADSAAATPAPSQPAPVIETPPAPVVQAPPVPTPAPAPTPAPTPAPQSSSSVIVTMPALGESVTEGTVTRWLKKVGEEIKIDEPLLEVSTDKVDTEIPSPASGTLLTIDVAVDSTAAVGARLATIGSSTAASQSATTSVAPTPQPTVVAQPPATPAPVTPAPVTPASKTRASCANYSNASSSRAARYSGNEDDS